MQSLDDMLFYKGCEGETNHLNAGTFLSSCST